MWFGNSPVQSDCPEYGLNGSQTEQNLIAQYAISVHCAMLVVKLKSHLLWYQVITLGVI